ncbi:PREDICTED: prisilkin-39-like [Rhagoletis zephyria]|uniref:prisilkin-39-like n=1 Tax=Rhagoletis zephyria TaxID=28612 RepID=UPI000811785D|nr:PREDICTED: prisilkin-39-like [Rhagoletis zephyria]
MEFIFSLSRLVFNLGSLFGQNPGSNGYGTGYGYGNGNNYYPSSYRPSTYYPYKNNYYPTGTYPSNNYPGNYYPVNSGWSGSNYPNYATNGGYYPSTGGYGYNYGSTGTGYSPSTGTGYYPNTGTGYYPNTGTNILGGNGGYGGYGGNGGLNQYYGYGNPLYAGQRNRGYGYYADTDRYGLPRYDGGYNDRPYVGRGAYGSYRGYD